MQAKLASAEPSRRAPHGAESTPQRESRSRRCARRSRSSPVRHWLLRTKLPLGVRLPLPPPRIHAVVATPMPRRLRESPRPVRLRSSPVSFGQSFRAAAFVLSASSPVIRRIEEELFLEVRKPSHLATHLENSETRVSSGQDRNRNARRAVALLDAGNSASIPQAWPLPLRLFRASNASTVGHLQQSLLRTGSTASGGVHPDHDSTAQRD